MKALVVGFGSIGERHVRALGAIEDVETAVVSRRAVDTPRLFPTIEQALDAWEPDYVVVASRTSEHIDDVGLLARLGFSGTLLVEKPIYHRPAETPGNGFAHCFVGYDLRFHPVIRRLRELLAGCDVHAVHAYVGQYLPEWRPGRDYRDTQAAKADDGGGVLRELSHELDYLCWCLGPWRRLTASGGQLSGLDIDSDDVFSVLFETERCPVVTANLNCLDSVARREITALTSSGTVRADLIAGTVEHGGEIERAGIKTDALFVAEHRAAISGDDGAICGETEALEVVAMIDGAERAAREKVWVDR